MAHYTTGAGFIQESPPTCAPVDRWLLTHPRPASYDTLLMGRAISRKACVFLLCCILATLAAVVHISTVKNGFTNLDDPEIVLNNRGIRGLSSQHVGALFSKSYAGLGGYTPLVLLSYAIEYHFFGLQPGPFHATNLILHVGNTLLVFWLMTLVTGGLGLGFVTTLFFAVHPVHVEPIAWIQGRKDLLFSFFFLSGLLAYIGFIRRDRRRIFYLAATVLFGLSLFSKVTAISFPFVILLLEKHFTGRIDRQALARSIPFWIMSALFFLLAFVTHNAMMAGTLKKAPSYWQSLSAFFYAFPFYAGKILAPLKLFPGYQNKIGHDPAQAVLNFIAFVCLIALLVWGYRRKPRLVTFGVSFAILTLLPTLPFHLFGQPYEDRYLYLPLAGVLAALSALLPDRVFTLRPLSREALTIGPALVVAATMLGVASSRQVGVWHDSLSLWGHAEAMDPMNPVGFVKKGEALDDAGRLSEALAEYDRAELLRPDSPVIPQHKGSVYFKLGDYQKALQEYARSLALDPLFHDGYLSRGILWGRLGNYDRAIRDLTVALKLNETFRAYYYRALAYRELKQNDLALQDMRKAYQINPRTEVRDLIEQWTADKTPSQ